MDKLIIFDTTLRDGEQSPGASMNLSEKLRIAHQLEKLNVDVIEAGFPAASVGDFESVQAIAKEIIYPTICGLARALENDIIQTAKALKNAKRSRIHTFIASSSLHMKAKLNMTPDQVLSHTQFAIKLAKEHADEVEFSPEDAGRSDFDFLCQIIELAIESGASTINIPDTVGYNTPNEFGSLIERLMKKVPNADRAIFSVHCHDDLGLSTANALAGVMAGARQVECTINGLGERAGNSALEEIVMAIHTRPQIFKCKTDIVLKEIVPTSRLVSGVSGFVVQPNKAVVGLNAFSHASGIHQDGVLKNRGTYEIMRAEDLGWHTNHLILAKHSGRNAFRTHLKGLGIEFGSEKDLEAGFLQFKSLADQKQYVHDDDLLTLFRAEKKTDTQAVANFLIELLDIRCSTGMNEAAQASVSLKVSGVVKTAHASGLGVIDALFKAIESIANTKVQLILYSVQNITEGTDSVGTVSIRLSADQKIVQTHGAHTDIVVASALAYINGLNKLFDQSNEQLPDFEVNL